MDDPNVLEIWNIVFIQMNREKDGNLVDLPAQHVDTGMGLERLVSVMQQKMSNYDTDVFMPIFDKIAQETGTRPYAGKVGKDDADGVDMAYRVVADHIRTLTFSITDGAEPSNDGRGYVLRRILRRAVRYGRSFLNAKTGFFANLVDTVIALMGDAFPELKKDPESVKKVIKEEEESFSKTLDKGLLRFNEMVEKNGKITGEDAFMLHDTFGFPIDLTELMGEEKNVSVDSNGFAEHMKKAKEQSKMRGGDASGGTPTMVFEAAQTDALEKKGVPPTTDAAKYDWQSSGSGPVFKSLVKALYQGKDFVDQTQGDSVAGVVLEATNCYAEAGGQQYDVARIRSANGEFNVVNVQKYGSYIVHIGSGSLKVGDEVDIEVDFERRADIAKNHTSTHILNFALRKVLGTKVDQRGSFVSADKMRFDFTNSAPVKPDQCGEAERIVSEQIAANYDIYTKEVPLAAAREICSLRAVFNEQYPDPVRVVSVGQDIDKLLADPKNEEWQKHSVEFCGGTHLRNFSEAQAFCIVAEEAVAKGIRRVECRSGKLALECIQAADTFESKVKAIDEKSADLDKQCAALLTELETAVLPVCRIDLIKKQINSLRTKAVQAGKAALEELAKKMAEAATQIAKESKEAGKPFVVAHIDAQGNVKAMEAAMKGFLATLNTIPVMMITTSDEEKKIAALAEVPKDLSAKISAKDWVAETLAVCGGKGGGKPERAQGQGKEPEKLREVLEVASKLATSKLA
jgi:alanyl-tRNA synthetase